MSEFAAEFAPPPARLSWLGRFPTFWKSEGVVVDPVATDFPLEEEISRCGKGSGALRVRANANIAEEVRGTGKTCPVGVISWYNP